MVANCGNNAGRAQEGEVWRIASVFYSLEQGGDSAFLQPPMSVPLA